MLRKDFKNPLGQSSVQRLLTTTIISSPCVETPLCGSVVENSPANAGDARHAVSIPGSGRCPGEGNGNPLQYSCLENPMDRGAWQAAVVGLQIVGHNLTIDFHSAENKRVWDTTCLLTH